MQLKQPVEELIAKQNKIIAEIEAQGQLNEKLRKAIDNVQKWAEEATADDGHDTEAREWPIKDFALELKNSIEQFDKETKQDIQEYEWMVEKIPYNYDGKMDI